MFFKDPIRFVALLLVPSSGLWAQTGLAPGTLYKQASPAVVVIEALGSNGKVASTGSGLLVSADGKLLTNYHVVAHAKQATVKLANGDAYDIVEVIAVDKRKDIAFLKIPAVELPFVRLGRSSGVEIGNTVYSIGSPMGLQNTLSQGLVSGIRDMDGYRLFQISAPISHGSSGGPIFNMTGEVIGIAVLTIDGGQNLNFAIPIDYARGMLGMSQTQPLTSIYEPEPAAPKSEPEPTVPPQPSTPAAPAAAATSLSPTEPRKIPDEMRTNVAGFLEKKLTAWTEDEAKVPLGEPARHRYGYDQQKTIVSNIFAYRDPTNVYREFELAFDAKTKRMVGVYLYPVNMTWEQCKKLWGENVNTIKNADGSRIYAYKERHVNVLITKEGKVINVGLY
ncbi:MAG: trypsin-like peptidase domain-containing protein [Candidatus Solibacter sp.]